MNNPFKIGDKVRAIPEAVTTPFDLRYNLELDKVYTIDMVAPTFVGLKETGKQGYSWNRFVPVDANPAWMIIALKSLGYTVEPPKTFFKDLKVGAMFEWSNGDLCKKVSEHSWVLNRYISTASGHFYDQTPVELIP